MLEGFIVTGVSEGTMTVDDAAFNADEIEGEDGLEVKIVGKDVPIINDAVLKNVNDITCFDGLEEKNLNEDISLVEIEKPLEIDDAARGNWREKMVKRRDESIEGNNVELDSEVLWCENALEDEEEKEGNLLLEDNILETFDNTADRDGMTKSVVDEYALKDEDNVRIKTEDWLDDDTRNGNESLVKEDIRVRAGDIEGKEEDKILNNGVPEVEGNWRDDEIVDETQSLV